MAAAYVILSLTTAILFILTREITVDVEKREFLSVKIDLIFFAIHLYNTDKSKNDKKSKAKNKKAANPRFVYKKIKKLLSRSEVRIHRLYIPIFDIPLSPAAYPFTLGGRALNFALLAYIKSLAGRTVVSDEALLPVPDSPTVYHIELVAPLYDVLFTVIAIRLEKLKKEKSRKNVGN